MPTGSEEPREEFAKKPNTESEPKRDKEKAEIAGCSFSVYPMDNDYVEIIKSALTSVNMSKVWSKTDDVSTVIRGRVSHVFDVSRAVFSQAADTGEHVTLRATYSIGCFGDDTVDVPSVSDDDRLNEAASADINRSVSVKFALYPLGDENYAEVINNQIEAIKDQGINTSLKHYETRLEGDTEKVFKGLEKVFRNSGRDGAHTVMTVAMVAHNVEGQ